jgi:multidrug resistance efflux pump
VIAISGAPGLTIQAVDVRVGDEVKRGDPLVELDNKVAKLDEILAELNLDAMTKVAEIRFKVEALMLQLAEQRVQRAQREAMSYRAIGPEGTSEKEIARLQGAVEESRMALAIEQAKDQQLRAETEGARLNAAKRFDLAKLSADRSVLRAPSDGTVLRVDQSVGEIVTGAPILKFANLSSMFVVCQVYQGDLLRLRAGLKATIKASGVPDLGSGIVERISRMIDARSQLGEVRIRLENAEPANHLVGLEVEVKIAL